MTCPKCKSDTTEYLRGKTFCRSCGATTEKFKTWGQYIAQTATGYMDHKILTREPIASLTPPPPSDTTEP